MTTKIIIARATLGLLAGIASLGAQPPAAVSPAERFQQAIGFEEFVLADTARQQEWLRNFKAAGIPVAAALPRVEALPHHWRILVIAESWCNDAVNSVPYLARLAAASEKLEMRFLRKADAPELLQTHLLDGRAATPLVLLYDEQFVEHGAWVEQPAALRKLVASKEGRVCENTLRENVKAWRLEDDGRSVLNEVIALMENAPAPTTTHRPR